MCNIVLVEICQPPFLQGKNKAVTKDPDSFPITLAHLLPALFLDMAYITVECFVTLLSPAPNYLLRRYQSIGILSLLLVAKLTPKGMYTLSWDLIYNHMAYMVLGSTPRT